MGRTSAKGKKCGLGKGEVDIGSEGEERRAAKALEKL